jgi:hypothetical protein
MRGIDFLLGGAVGLLWGPAKASSEVGSTALGTIHKARGGLSTDSAAGEDSYRS